MVEFSENTSRTDKASSISSKKTSQIHRKEIALQKSKINHVGLWKEVDSCPTRVDFEHDLSGIFKPAQKSPLQRGAYKERAAYIVDRALHFDLVPPTVIRNIQGEAGTIQELISNSQLGTIKPEGSFKLWIFDYVIFNADRTLDNYLVEEKEKKELYEKKSDDDDVIYAIDNEDAFFDDIAVPQAPRRYAMVRPGDKKYYGKLVPSDIRDKINNYVDTQSVQELLIDKLSELLPKRETKAVHARIKHVGKVINKKGYMERDDDSSFFPR